MAKPPVKTGTYLPRDMEDDPIDRARPGSASQSWLSFRYSYTEVSLHGEAARVKAKSVRNEGGRVIRESFEGELGRDAYDRVVRETQHAFIRQASVFLDSLALMLPFSRKRRPGRE